MGTLWSLATSNLVNDNINTVAIFHADLRHVKAISQDQSCTAGQQPQHTRTLHPAVSVLREAFRPQKEIPLTQLQLTADRNKLS